MLGPKISKTVPLRTVAWHFPICTLMLLRQRLFERHWLTDWLRCPTRGLHIGLTGSPDPPERQRPDDRTTRQNYKREHSERGRGRECIIRVRIPFTDKTRDDPVADSIYHQSWHLAWRHPNSHSLTEFPSLITREMTLSQIQSTWILPSILTSRVTSFKFTLSQSLALPVTRKSPNC